MNNDKTQLFFGTKTEYQSFKKNTGIVLDHAEEQQKNDKNSAPRTVIKSDDTTMIDQEILDLLKRTRHRQPVDIVYMQSDISFYDTFYNADDSQDELTLEARGIKRVYKNYPKYLYAMYIREMYMDRLESKYPNLVIFQSLMAKGLLDDWVPPLPIYSTRADDYEESLTGVNTSDEFEWKDDDIIKIISDNLNEMVDDVSEIGIDTDVLTDIMFIRVANGDGSKDYRSKNVTSSINISELESLQRMFKSWYKPEDVDSEFDKLGDVFKNTPAKIRERYYLSLTPDMTGLLDKAMRYESLDSEFLDENEMVFDSVTNKPMSRKELGKRNLIRFLGDAGWDTVKLMREMNVGSNYERSKLNDKNRNKKKPGSVVTESDKPWENESYDIYGDPMNSETVQFSDFNSMMDTMFPG
jgi:hypothetical protein